MTRALVISLVAMMAMQIFVTAACTVGSVLAPAAAPDFGVSAHLISAYVSVMFAFGAASGLISGGYVVRFGPLRIAQICLLFSAVGVGLASVGSPVLALAGAALLGVGMGPATPASSQIMMRVTPPQWMNIIFSLRQTGVPLGMGLAGVTAPLLEARFDWRVAALVSAAACIACAAALQPLRGRFDAERDRNRRIGALAQITTPVKMMLGQPEMRRYGAVTFFYNGLQMCLTTYLVTFLTERVEMSLILAGSMLAVAQGAAVVGRLVWGAAADYLWRARAVLGWLGVAMSVFSVITGMFTADWPTILIGIVVFAFGGTSATWNGVLIAQMARLAPPGRVSEAIGISGFTGFSGVAVVPALFGVMLSLTDSYALGFTASAVTTLIGGVWLLRTADAKPDAGPDAERKP
jgi:MFS family permease